MTREKAEALGAKLQKAREGHLPLTHEEDAAFRGLGLSQNSAQECGLSDPFHAGQNSQAITVAKARNG